MQFYVFFQVFHPLLLHDSILTENMQTDDVVSRSDSKVVDLPQLENLRLVSFSLIVTRVDFCGF